MNFNKQQEKTINTIEGNIAVIAAAGSGKTTVLTHRIKNMIQNHGILPSSILAIGPPFLFVITVGLTNSSKTSF